MGKINLPKMTLAHVFLDQRYCSLDFETTLPCTFEDYGGVCLKIIEKKIIKKEEEKRKSLFLYRLTLVNDL